MNKRELEQAFDAYFHSKAEYSFNDFCSFSLEQEITLISANKRVLCTPTPKLKQYLRFVDRVLLRYVELDEDVVHSYVRGKSALTAVRAHAGNTHFFTTDIKSFFRSISSKDVKKILLHNVNNVPVSDLIKHVDRLTTIMTRENVLPVGFPTSPLLSNAFLLDFDRALHRYCQNMGFIYTRYSDDIIISSDSFDGFESLEGVIQSFLENCSIKLRLNLEKTKYRHIGNKVKILGLVITQNGHVTIDSKHKKLLETLLYFYTTDIDRFNQFVNEKWQEKEHALFGLLHYARSVDPDYLGKLQRKYGAYALRSLMKDRWDD